MKPFAAKTIAFLLLAVAPLARGQDEPEGQGALTGPDGLERLLPAQPELKVTHPQAGQPLFSLRGRDVSAAVFLAKLADEGGVSILIDKAAAEPLRTTIVSVDLRERRADFTVDLLAAASGCDVARELSGFRVLGPPAPDANTERPLALDAAHRFYEMALTRQRDADVAARALRGTAELYRRVGDWSAAYTTFETLLSRFPHSPSSRGAEILLADCYAAVGDRVRALGLLKATLDRTSDREASEEILARVLVILVAEQRLREISDLRGALLRVAPLEPQTVAVVAEAAGALEDAGDAHGAVMLLQDLWRFDPDAHGPFGPMLALALLDAGDSSESEAVVSEWMQHSPGAFDVPAALVACAELARRAGDRPAALLFAERALTVPDTGVAAKLRAHVLVADVCEELGLDKRARRHLYEAERISKPSAAARLALRSAQLALDQNEPEHARLLFQDALKYPEAHGDAELGIARALLATGEPGRARDVVQKLLDCDDLSAKVTSSAIDLGTEALLRLNAFDRAVALMNGDLDALLPEPNPGDRR